MSEIRLIFQCIQRSEYAVRHPLALVIVHYIISCFLICSSVCYIRFNIPYIYIYIYVCIHFAFSSHDQLINVRSLSFTCSFSIHLSVHAFLELRCPRLSAKAAHNGCPERFVAAARRTDVVSTIGALASNRQPSQATYDPNSTCKV